MKKMILFISLSFCFTLFLQAQRHVLLGEAFLKRDTSLFDEFLENWEKEIQPISDSYLARLSDTVQAAYEVFEAVQRLEKQMNARKQIDKATPKQLKYKTVSTKLEIYVIKPIMEEDKEESENHEYIITAIEKDSLASYLQQFPDSQFIQQMFWKYKIPTQEAVLAYRLTDFRPQNFDEQPLLFLDSTYGFILNYFLGHSYTFSVNGFPNLSQEERNNVFEHKFDFINQRLSIECLGLSMGWRLTSYPVVGKMTFSADLKFVEVDLSTENRYRMAFLKKENDSWKLICFQPPIFCR